MRTCHVRSLLFLCGVVASLEASAAEYFIQVQPLSRTMPDGQVVTMWGYALDEDHDFSTLDSPVTVPGPRLEVPAGDTTLTVHLYNGLTVPTSLVLPGQVTAMSPTWVDGGAVYVGQRPAGNVTARVRSLTHETAPGTAGVYSWTGLKPGTWLYQSGTHSAVQVQMGLYGAMVKAAGASEAYPGVAYEREVTLLFSEVDPVLHEAVASGTYGPGGTVTSTIGYRPRYFLINGEPYSAAVSPLPAGRVGERILLRFLSAGQQTRVPVLQGAYLSLVAEGGSPLRYPQRQYSVLLPAGGTVDALLTPGAQGVLPLYDRRLGLSNGTATGGGMLRLLQVSP
jgi:FtsP/CotA-like multicopper oxidase with cupredoxin domain